MRAAYGYSEKLYLLVDQSAEENAGSCIAGFLVTGSIIVQLAYRLVLFVTYDRSAWEWKIAGRRRKRGKRKETNFVHD
ncbi:hypothetical protein ANCCEY_07817 [Ancylostoma ceylanicum]|uniref:Uncharacterized protein n=1 Tax=Ancylostoma ceylanicum TaxID=53326 RepID=A0A0D6LMI2_9BILA|nr:hypothetical protein ANCCEY_07817 [Ancylostoma ceylanicum]